MLVSPSVLTADFTNLKNEIDQITSADYIHIDIMDGHFVPNISFGPSITKSINEITDNKLDVHLMVSEPLKWIDQFSLSNVEFITVHVESNNYYKAIDQIKKNGKKVGISIKPYTPIDEIIGVFDQVDLVLVMTVEPGFGGQSFMTDMLEKVKKIKNIRDNNDHQFIIEVDGGVNNKTIDLCKKAGVDMVVAGSYVFNKENKKKAIDSLR